LIVLDILSETEKNAGAPKKTQRLSGPSKKAGPANRNVQACILTKT